MELAYLGHSAFRIKGKTATVVTDPFDSQMVGLKFPRVEAEIVTVSHSHDDHNKVENVGGVRKVIDGPGEYEVSGISILGYATYHDAQKGAERGKNTIYVIEVDGKRILHLGDLGHALSNDILEDMGDIDILLIPVGGKYTIGPKEAVEVVHSVDPKVIIPMHYGDPALNQETFAGLNTLDDFINEMATKVERLPKLRDDTIPAEDQLMVILEKK